jgi:DNA-binding transcriptional LysR family regulator
MNYSPKQVSQHPSTIHHQRAKFNSRPHDVQNIYVSLKQWRILHAVIDCGGYAEAAKVLHLSQSTISYTVGKLQEQLGIALLRIEGRKAVLTVEGKALLDRSRLVLKEAIELESLAKSMVKGWGGEVRLVVDHNFPTHLLMQALSRFHACCDGAAQVRLREVSTLQADEVLRDLNVDLAISEHVPLGFLGEPLVEVEYLPVAYREHPLIRLGREVTASDLAQAIQIGIGQEKGQEGEQHARPLNRWAMSSFDTALAAVTEGLGYAWLPQHRIRKWLEEGTLVRLPLADKRIHKAVLYLIHGRPWAATPAAGRLAELLRAQAAHELPTVHAVAR